MKKSTLLILGLVIIVGVVLVILNNNERAGNEMLDEEIIEEEVVDEEEAEVSETDVYRFGPASDEVVLESPLPGETVSSPLTISGFAPGYWFFEATAPVLLTDWNGLIIGEGIVMPQGDWMSDELLPFSGTIEYELSSEAPSFRGNLILQRDNPSALPENDAAVEFAVELTPTD